MASDIVSDALSGLAASVSGGWREARAEHIRRTTPIAHWHHLFDNFAYSPREFYELVKQHLDQREIPDLLTDYIEMHEGTVFSKRRRYLELRRERFVFQICAASFGKGWFVSSRLFDKRKGAKWWDFLVVLCFLPSPSGALSVLFGFGLLGHLAMLGMAVTLFWSLMRLAASESVALLDDQICRIPCLGRVYETLFHPDTYFRQDQRNMYRAAVQRSLTDALGDLHTHKGLKPLSEEEGRPVMDDLKRR